MANAPGNSLATTPFLLLALATTLGYANYWTLLPVIPLYVNELGYSAFVAGLVLLAFSVPSFVVRPFLGRVADKWSSAGVLAIGLVALATGTLVLLLPTLALIVLANTVRGLGWAGVNTGSFAMLAMVAPPARRGEASGYFNAAIMATSIIFPAAALWLVARPGGFQNAFLAATLLGLLGLPIALGLARAQRRASAAALAAREDSERAKSAQSAMGAGGAQGAAAATGAAAAAGAADAGPWIDRSVLLATGLNLCSSLVSPALSAFLPLYALSLGVENIQWFYVVAGITSVIVQPLLGKKSDSIGHGTAIGLGLASQSIGFVLIILAQDIVLMVIGGFFAALGGAVINAMTTALAMTVADPRFRGRAMATYSMSWQIGAGAGAVLAGALADLTGLRGMYAGCIVISLAGMVALASAWKTLPRPNVGV